MKLDFFQHVESVIQKVSKPNNGNQGNVLIDKKDSNADTLFSPESKVDVRTGNYRFSIPVGFYSIGTKSMTIQLGYSSNLAVNEYNDWLLGFGWYLNIPYIKYFFGKFSEQHCKLI